MPDQVARLFENELKRRSIRFSIDADSGRYRLQYQGGTSLVSLENLVKEFTGNRDEARIVSFVDSVLFTFDGAVNWVEARQSAYFCLEPSDYVEKPELRKSISDQIDRVPITFNPSKGTLTWVTPRALAEWDVSLAEFESAAAENLSKALELASVEYSDIDGVRLGYLGTSLPFKTALTLAPNLKTVVSDILGWPLYAVVPDRDFLYLWDCRHEKFAGRVGSVVIREYTNAPYPISTELLRISDEGIEAVGAFAARE